MTDLMTDWITNRLTDRATCSLTGYRPTDSLADRLTERLSVFRCVYEEEITKYRTDRVFLWTETYFSALFVSRYTPYEHYRRRYALLNAEGLVLKPDE
jgi:hypothetical protein